jgi:hypothetical protein
MKVMLVVTVVFEDDIIWWVFKDRTHGPCLSLPHRRVHGVLGKSSFRTVEEDRGEFTPATLTAQHNFYSQLCPSLCPQPPMRASSSLGISRMCIVHHQHTHQVTNKIHPTATTRKMQQSYGTLMHVAPSPALYKPP